MQKKQNADVVKKGKLDSTGKEKEQKVQTESFLVKKHEEELLNNSSHLIGTTHDNFDTVLMVSSS